jgi:hypothetical protein
MRYNFAMGPGCVKTRSRLGGIEDLAGCPGDLSLHSAPFFEYSRTRWQIFPIRHLYPSHFG